MMYTSKVCSLSFISFCLALALLCVLDGKHLGNVSAGPILTVNSMNVYQTPTQLLPHSNSRTALPTKIPPPAPAGFPPTWTPLLTYPPVQARQIVMDLYKNNPCKLPCWWGITPGKTDWREAWQFLGRFAQNKSPWGVLLLKSKELPGYMFFRTELNVPKTIDLTRYSSLNDLEFTINIKTYKVDYINVNTGNIADYTIPRILSHYGKPEEIYAFGSPHPVPHLDGIHIDLYYPQFGFISSHFATVKTQDWDKPKITACFQKVSILFLWSPERKLEYQQRLGMSLVDSWSIEHMMPIQHVSDVSIDDFYKAHVNDRDQTCVEFNTANFIAAGP